MMIISFGNAVGVIWARFNWTGLNYRATPDTVEMFNGGCPTDVAVDNRVRVESRV